MTQMIIFTVVVWVLALVGLVIYLWYVNRGYADDKRPPDDKP